MVLFVLEEFNGHVIAASVGSAEITQLDLKKKTPYSKERNANLRDLYMYNSWGSDFCSYYYVFVDESGCDKRSALIRMGSSPFSVTLILIVRF